MKQILTLVIGVFCAALTGCSDDNTLFNEPQPIRAYETDALIMAQFVEVDRTTGVYVLNPDKKITGIDYICNKSREDLMSVSPINKSRFIKEMEAVNYLLSATKKSEHPTPIIYATHLSDMVIDGNSNGRVKLTRTIEQFSNLNNQTSLTLEADRDNSANLIPASEMIMTVNADSNSSFYLAQITVGSHNGVEECVIITGVKSSISRHSYNMVLSSEPDDLMTMRGKTLIGNANITVSVSR